jgi:hypothetical protein
LASVRYRWSRIIPAVPSYEFNILPVSWQHDNAIMLSWHIDNMYII